MSDEMLMQYIWEGINDALGTDPTGVTRVAEIIYNRIKDRLEKEKVIKRKIMGIEDITNPLEYIECIIAFDSRDWSEDSRLAAIYAIVFGWGIDGDEKAYHELQNKYLWSDEAVQRLKKFHEEWERLKTEYDRQMQRQ